MRTATRSLNHGATLLALALVCSGCGYTLGYHMPEGVRTIAVPVFANETFPLRREVEYDVTRAVRRELEVRSDVRLTDSERADAVLEGTVVAFRQAVLTEKGGDAREDGRDDAAESSIHVTVQVRLVRSRDGEVLFDRRISDHATFSSLRGETIDDARNQAIDEIAERVVADLESW